MTVVGITGGIGSGKSIVSMIFRQLGIPVYEADAEAKKLYDIPEIISEVKKTFGAAYFSDGTLNKKKFADLVFKDGEALKKINAIIHPYVKKNFREWKNRFKDKPYVLKEAAILFESGTDKGCDKIIVVTSPETFVNKESCNAISVRKNRWKRSCAGNGAMRKKSSVRIL